MRTTARNPRLNLQCYVTEVCECGKHPRTVKTYEVVVSWIRGYRILHGLDPRPISKRSIPTWAR